MINKVEFDSSEALQRELNVYKKQGGSYLRAPFLRFPTLNDFMGKKHEWDVYHHMSDFFHLLGNINGKRIIDIGCGLGYTSIFLAANGNHVTAVEPSSECCEVIDWNAQRYSVDLSIFQTTGEEIGNLPIGYDIALYHGSLHHADDPLAALKQTFGKLVEGGTIYLIAESILKFYRSKNWYNRMLIEQPVRVGHYGGNEHVYRSHEYESMLSITGFENIKVLPSVTGHNLLVKAARDLAFPLFNSLSMLQASYVGTKPKQ